MSLPEGSCSIWTWQHYYHCVRANISLHVLNILQNIVWIYIRLTPSGSPEFTTLYIFYFEIEFHDVCILYNIVLYSIWMYELEVSWNRGTSKWSILDCFFVKHPAMGVPPWLWKSPIEFVIHHFQGETDAQDALAQVVDHGREGDEQIIRSLLRFLRTCLGWFLQGGAPVR